MSKHHLFDSYSKTIPGIRRDIDLISVENNGKPIIYFHDSLGYMPEHFALDAAIRPLLTFFTGGYSISQVSKFLNGDIHQDNLLEFVQLLDENLALKSDHYNVQSDKIETAFEESQIRPPVLSGKSYPEKPEKLDAFLESVFTESSNESIENEHISALFAPHIDISVGRKVYSDSFSQLRSINPKKVLILATSHYGGYYPDLYDGYPFIGTLKNYVIPGKVMHTDKSLMHELSSDGHKTGFTLKDRAHRVEHSIETHLLFLSNIWSHNYTIIPILVGGMDEILYHSSGDIAQKVDQFSSRLKSLIDKDTFILISGDLSHVGKKFGDSKPAEQLRSSVEHFDSKFLKTAKQGNPDKMLQCISQDYDSTRICGFPPLYTFLKMALPGQGKLLNYHWWDETERESAVSFGSILYT